MPELAFICHTSRAAEKGKKIVSRMAKELPRQQFAIALQAAIGSKIVARSNVKAMRKDVTAKCYGGDLTRQMKLLRHQAEGKKRMKAIGNVRVSKEVFVKLLKND